MPAHRIGARLQWVWKEIRKSSRNRPRSAGRPAIETATFQDVDPHWITGGGRERENIDADMAALPQSPGRTEQEHQAEHEPLRFQQSVRAPVEDIAQGGGGGAGQRAEQDQPSRPMADRRVQGIDGCRDAEAGTSCASSWSGAGWQWTVAPAGGAVSDPSGIRNAKV